MGVHGGMMGETCVLAILLGLAYLVYHPDHPATIPASIVATMFFR